MQCNGGTRYGINSTDSNYKCVNGIVNAVTSSIVSSLWFFIWFMLLYGPPGKI